ncbi:MAG: ATP-binding protein, partial [Betaproteobacteria bacterium]
RWDEDRLAQLAVNLLANALEHGPRDRAVSVAATCREGTAIICVANPGEIAPDLLPLLFDPFRAGVDRAENPSGGLGLGLYIVQQIAAAHGGSVAVKSEQGMVTFTVRLPLEPSGSPSTLPGGLLPP